MMLSRPVIWVHEGCLSPASPPYTAYPGAPSLYVFDPARIAAEATSLKRIAFVYECLLETPATIRKGDVVEELLRFAREHDADGVVTTASVDPRQKATLESVAKHLPVRVLEVPPLVAHPGPFDLGRFSRFWNKAEKHAWGK